MPFYFLSYIGRLIAQFAGKRVTDIHADTQTHKTTAVTLAAYARRGLISSLGAVHTAQGVAKSLPMIEGIALRRMPFVGSVRKEVTTKSYVSLQ